MSKEQKIFEDDLVEPIDRENNTTDVIVDDYKDLAIEMMPSSREKTLWWMKDYD